MREGERVILLLVTIKQGVMVIDKEGGREEWQWHWSLREGE